MELSTTKNEVHLKDKILMPYFTEFVHHNNKAVLVRKVHNLDTTPSQLHPNTAELDEI